MIHVPNDLEQDRIGILERMVRDIFWDYNFLKLYATNLEKVEICGIILLYLLRKYLCQLTCITNERFGNTGQKSGS